MFLRKIDDTGLFVEDVITDAVPTILGAGGEEIPDPHYITEPYQGGFYWPKWDGEKWVEGGTEPEAATPGLDQTKDQVRTAVESATTILGLKKAMLLWLESGVDNP